MRQAVVVVAAVAVLGCGGTDSAEGGEPSGPERIDSPDFQNPCSDSLQPERSDDREELESHADNYMNDPNNEKIAHSCSVKVRCPDPRGEYPNAHMPEDRQDDIRPEDDCAGEWRVYDHPDKDGKYVMAFRCYDSRCSGG